MMGISKSSKLQDIKVFFVIPGGTRPGVMIFAKRLGVNLANSGIKIHPFFLGSRISPAILVREMIRFRKEIQLFRPSLIHAQYGTMTALFCMIFGIVSGIPVIITFRGSDLNPNPGVGRIKWNLGYLFSQIAAWGACWIICVSKQLKDRLWWGKNKVVVIPSGVDTELFFLQEKGAARRRLNWGDKERVVLFNAGNDPIIKRLDLAQAAIEVAMQILGEIRFMVLDGNFPPHIIPIMMNAADCLLLTSDWEGSPTILQEAMACNLPVVTVDVGDVTERLTEEKISRIVARDPVQLGSTLAEILMKRERSNGRELVRDCSYDAIILKLISLYYKVVNE
jgi:teichuronic acid biosynthesis glycosyltransferase TuaC